MSNDKTSLMDGAALERFRDEAKRLMRQKKIGTIDGDTMLRLIAHIDALTAENERLRTAAESIVSPLRDAFFMDNEAPSVGVTLIDVVPLRRLRDALERGDGGE